MNKSESHRVIVAGGTGLVGTRLVAELLKQGLQVQVLSRTPRRAQLPAGAEARGWEELPEMVEGSLAVINLAGEGIADHRWNEARKKTLLESRTNPTRHIVSALAQASQKPLVLVNASAIGIYGTQGAAAIDEAQAPGRGFLTEICRAWEAEAEAAQGLGLRVVKLRIGVVLAREGGALPKMALPIRCCMGSALGDGRQGFSWIHIEDLVRLILESLQNPAYLGPINATAPAPCSNLEVTQLIAKRLHRPVWPIPPFLTRNAVRLLVGEMAEPMLLGGAFVLPKRALALGFHFKFPRAADALEDLL